MWSKVFKISISGFSIHKELTRKLEVEQCSTKPLAEILSCWKKELAVALNRAEIKCKVPALEYTDFDASHIEDCTNTEDALVVENIIYQVSQDNLKKGVCDGAKPCETSDFVYLTIKQFSRYTLTKGNKVIKMT